MVILIQTLLVDMFVKLRIFIYERNLTAVWNIYDVDFTHSHETNGVTSTSVIDDVFINESGLSSLVDAGVLHIPEDASDHCPVYCVLDTNGLKVEKTKAQITNPRPSWKRAEPEEKGNFVNILRVKLDNIEIPNCAQDCSDVHCSNDDHIEAIDNYTEKVFESLDLTAKQALPNIGGKKEDRKLQSKEEYSWVDCDSQAI